MDFGIGKVLPVNIEDEMKNSYIDYAMSVIVMRALPDVRDGMNSSFVGWPSSASKSRPSLTTIAASPAWRTAGLFACGVAMPSPSPVVPEASRSRTALR